MAANQSRSEPSYSDVDPDVRTYDQSVNPDKVGTLPLSDVSYFQQTLSNQARRFPVLNFALAAHGASTDLDVRPTRLKSTAHFSA
jgi:hypothetical protein